MRLFEIEDGWGARAGGGESTLCDEQPSGISVAVAWSLSNRHRNEFGASHSCGFKPRQLITTVDEVERRTGFDFFSKLPAAEQSRLESAADWEAWR